VDRLFATQVRSITDVDDRVRLEQRRHAVDISRVLPRDQQALQVLGVARRLSLRRIVHRTLRQQL